MPTPGVVGSVTARRGGFTSTARTQLNRANCARGPHALGIVVVDYHTTEELRLFVQSLLDSAPQLPYALVIESVQATDDEALLAGELATLVSDFALSAANTVHSDNVGYARACNDGAHLLSLYDEFDTYAFFNSDTRIREGVLESCVELLWKDPSYGVLGPRQVDENENITSAGIFGTLSKPEMRYWHRPASQLGMDIRDDAVSVSGSAYFVKKHVFDELTQCPIYQESDPDSPGAFLQTPLYYEETYFSYHAQAHDYKVVYNGEATMVHRWHKSISKHGDNHWFSVSKEMFVAACDHHGIDHD
jgi:GT2 family glycosyltransferase